MTQEIVSVLCGPHMPEVQGHSLTYVVNHDNANSPCWLYQGALERTTADVLVYAHNDLSIHDSDWLSRVLAFFENPQCVAVGLGGALGLGNRDLYRKPYSIWNLARRGYASNQDDAETHGERFTGARRCATIEQFFMAIRTDWLRSIGGWPIEHLTHHLLDAFIACEAARSDKEIWQVGVSCLHSGGGSSTTDGYAKAPWLIGGTMASDHEIPHRWIYDRYRDVLPLEIAP